MPTPSASAKTQPSLLGIWSRRYGSFASKTELTLPKVFRLERIIQLAQATANQKVPVTLVDATDNETQETGVVTPTIEWSFEGAAYAALSDGTWAEIGNGDYTVTLNATDTAETGWGLLRVVKTSVTAETKVFVEISTSPTERRSDYIRTRSQQRTRR